MHHATGMIAHTTDFGTPVVEYWLEREIAQCVHHEIDPTTNGSIGRRSTMELRLVPRHLFI